MNHLTPKAQRDIKSMYNRVVALNGLTAHEGNFAGLDEKFKAAMAEPDAESLTKTHELLKRSRTGDTTAITELNALRTETIDLYLRATTQFASFFCETVTLGADESASFIHTYREPVNVTYMGADGGPRTYKAVKAQKVQYVDMRELQTDSIGYQIRDVNQGPQIAAAAQATVDLAWDMANKVDKTVFDFLTSGTNIYGNFTTTGTKLNRTFVLHDRINTDNIPTTNELTPADVVSTDTNDAATKLRWNAFGAVVKYCDSFGDIFGAPLRPTGVVFVPSSETTHIVSSLTPTVSLSSGATGGNFVNVSTMTDGLLNNYTSFSYLGINWKLIPDVTLEPGVCYPVLNRPVARLYVKPSYDEEFVTTDRKKNWEERSLMKAIGLVTVPPWNVFACRVTYHS